MNQITTRMGADAGELPSIQGLNTFAIVARHDSFSSAADELEIGQSAVSHAIRQLERWFGCALFERDHRGIRLTAEGRILADGVGAGLTRVHQAVRDVQYLHDHATEVVAISVSTATASNWLIPRLAAFKAAHPDISIPARWTYSCQLVEPGGRDANAGHCAMRRSTRSAAQTMPRPSDPSHGRSRL